MGLFNQISFYQFDFQQITFLDKIIRRGDRINLNCVYDTSRRTDPTKFAIGSEDEMCMEFIFYYPILFSSSNDAPYVFCGYVQSPQFPNNMSWCGDYNMQTALRPTLTNPTVWDPESLGDTTFGKESSVCNTNGDGSGDGDDDLGFWVGFLVGGGSVLAVLILLVASAAGAFVYYRRGHLSQSYEHL